MIHGYVKYGTTLCISLMSHVMHMMMVIMIKISMGHCLPVFTLQQQHNGLRLKSLV